MDERINFLKSAGLDVDSLKVNMPYSLGYILKAMDSYAEFKVKDKEKMANDGDKKSISDTDGANERKPLLGSCAFPDDKDFLSARGKPTPLGSIEGAQKEKKCHWELGKDYCALNKDTYCKVCTFFY